jgi:hypothetical protein
MTIEIPVNKDSITTVAGIIGAIALAWTPIVDGMDSTFDTMDACRLVLAAMFAINGYYTGKQPNGDKIPKGENLATTPVNPTPIV